MLHLREDTTRDMVSQPRAEGSMVLSSKARGAVSAIDALRTQGCLKALFPKRQDRVEAIVINTAGGLTGGDRLSLCAEAGAGSRLVLTTQAAERAYRASSGVARAENCLTVQDGARLDWLPQELILFEGARLNRSLHIDMTGAARLLAAEAVVFGRHATGERLNDVVFRDRIEISRDGTPLYCDALSLDGDLEAKMALPAIGRGAGAMAVLVYVGPDAETHLAPLRAVLPETGGASLVRPDVLVARVLAASGFALRRAVLPALDRLSRDALPVSWRL